MLEFVIDTLRSQDYQVSLAYYEPFSVNPDLSVPVFQLPLFKGVKTNKSESYFYCESHGVGCWLPELEFTHYWATELWQSLIASHDIHIAVSGSCLAALPFVQSDTLFLAWVASDWKGDREHRVKEFPWFRKLLDRLLVRPILTRLEKQIIATGNVIALSEPTQAVLNNLVFQQPVKQVLGMPIETSSFKPASRQQSSKIGFVGRFEDPRKNLQLLFESMALLLEHHPNLELALIGDKLSEDSTRLAKELGIWHRLSVDKYVNRSLLAQRLNELQVFVLPSHQEGLCIAALEAMSCGVPVVSTRCGGPESYIISGTNGLLCDSTPASMAAAITKLLMDRSMHQEMAKEARDTVLKEFNPDKQAHALLALFERQFK